MPHRSLARRTAAAIATAALILTGCGGSSPPPANVEPADQQQDAPTTPHLGAVDRARGVSDDMDARNQAILDALP